MKSPILHDLDARLARLELLERRRRRSTVAIAVAALAGLALGAVTPRQVHEAQDSQVAPIFENLRAKRIDIVDADGKVGCTLTTELEGPSAGAGLLVLRNAGGTSVCRMGSRDGNGALSLHGGKGTTGCSLGSFGDGGSIEVYGPAGDVTGRLQASGTTATLMLRYAPEAGVVVASDEWGKLASREAPPE